MTSQNQLRASETFDVTVRGTYRSWEIPPRCRKPRWVEHDTETTVSVPCVTSAAAPVGIENAHDRFRVFGGNIYEPMVRTFTGRPDEQIMAGDSDFSSEAEERFYDAHTAAEFAERAEKSLADYLVVGDGSCATRSVWVRCGEPRYVVQTFGFGGNHGGTGLFTNMYDNPNIAASAYFRADEFEDARAYAIKVAEERGDTDSIPRLKAMAPMITMHDPSVLRLRTPSPEAEDAVWECATALRNYSRLDESASAKEEQAAWDCLVAARERARQLNDGKTAGVSRPYEEGRA